MNITIRIIRPFFIRISITIFSFNSTFLMFEKTTKKLTLPKWVLNKFCFLKFVFEKYSQCEIWALFNWVLKNLLKKNIGRVDFFHFFYVRKKSKKLANAIFFLNNFYFLKFFFEKYSPYEIWAPSNWVLKTLLKSEALLRDILSDTTRPWAQLAKSAIG